MVKIEEITQEEMDELLTFVGGNSAYYAAAWSWPDQTKFNWVAFFFSFPWLIYRKMYVVAVLALIAVVFVGGLLSLLVPGFLVDVLAAAVCGYFGNRWYFWHCQRKVAELRSREPDQTNRLEMLAKRGGTNLLAAIALPVLLLVLLIFAL